LTNTQLLCDLSSYLRLGDVCLRRPSASVVFDFIRSMHKKGVDTHSAISNIFPKLEAIERSHQQLKTAWISMAIKGMFILIAALMLRFFLSNIAMETDSHDLFITDRVLIAISLLVLLMLIIWLYNHYLRKVRYTERNESLWVFVRAFMDIDGEALECPQMAPLLRKLLSEQIQSGLDSSGARRSIVVSQITDLHDGIENDLRSMGLFGVGVELVIYGIGFGGFIGGPILMWLESASGIN
jgi:uncharacterized membrane protein